MFKGSIRIAAVSDAAAMATIYAPIVRDTIISFEIEPPTPDELAHRIAATLKTHPWLVAEQEVGHETGHERRVIGFAYAGAHRDRAAYRWSVDVSVYVDVRVRRAGVGRALYEKLTRILQRQGFHAAFAGIALPNAASVGLHEAVGFKPVGIYEEVGFKKGQWQDVGWWRLSLSDADGPPEEPVPFAALPANITA